MELTQRVANLTPEQREQLLRRLGKAGRPAKAKPAVQWPDVSADPGRRHEPFPLSDIQQAYWIGRSAALELGGVACHIYREIDTRGLDVVRLEWALRQLVARHEMLRAIIRSDGRQQILAEPPVCTVPVQDLRGRPAGEVDAALQAVRDAMSHQVLPSDKAPLFEIRASICDDERVRLHCSLDVLVSDARSLDILFLELQQLYENPDVALPPLDLSFRDYLLAVSKLTGSETWTRSRDYWMNRLAALPPPPDLPLAKAPGAIDRLRFNRRTARLDADRWGRVKARAGRAGVTPSGVLLAAYTEVLAAWSKSPRFTLNLTLFNRLPIHPQVNDVIGDFTSVTMLEVDSAVAPTFEAHARRLQQQLWDDLDHRHFGGIEVVRELARRQGGSQGAVMPVVFTSILPDESDSARPLSTAWLGDVVYEITQTPQVWLDHIVTEDAGALVIKWDAVEELFPAGLLDDMFDAYARLLHRLSDGDAVWQESRYETARSLVPAAQLEVRKQVNATEAPVSNELMHRLFARQVPLRADAPAVITPTRTLSYTELDRRANQVGHWLRDRGAKPNTLVAIVMEKGWEQVVGALGVQAAGAAYLPIDATLPRERLAYLLDHGQVSLVLTQSWHDEAIEWPSHVQRLAVDRAAELGLDAGPLEPVQTPADLAYVIYTSGSTGMPKGVVIDHRGAVNTILDCNTRFGVTADDRVLALSALNFDLSVYDVFGLLAAGGTIVMPQAFSERNPSHWAEMIQAHGVTIWDTVPALMQMLVEYLSGRGEVLPGSLRLTMLSGDWIPIDLPDRIKAMRPGIEVVSLGGATEASIWSILYPVGTVDPSWPSIPYGKPMVNQTFHVLSDVLAPCPVWVPGHLYIGGIGLAVGYWRDEEKTNASFITHPHTGERLYRTGDLGRYLPDGNIEFQGRSDFQVKIRGHRIELGEIETTLLQHPAVKAAVVSAVGEARGSKRLVAYVVQEAGDGAQAGALAAVAAPVIGDPIERLRFKLRRPGLREEPARQTVALDGAGRSHDQLAAWLVRRSYRTYSDAPVEFGAFSALLGTLSSVQIPGAPLPKFRYASAGSLYPVQAYVYVKPNRIQGVASGIYYYHPARHELVLLDGQAAIDRRVFVHNEATFDGASFAVFLVADMAAIKPLYGELSRDFCLIEAGLICQLLEGEAPRHDLGLCQSGGISPESVRQILPLSGDHEYLHCLLGGRIEADQTGEEAYLESFADIRPILDAARTPAEAAASSPVAPVPAAGTDLGDVLREHLRSKLPEYMVPASIVFLDALPLSANGKVDRKALPVPQPAAAEAHAVQAEPSSDLERTIAGIWRDVLGIDAVGLHDNFFDLGGNSVHVVQVHSRLRETLGRDVPIIELFTQTTVAALAGSLSQATTEAASGAAAGIVDESEERAEARRALRRQQARRAGRVKKTGEEG